MQSSRFFQKHKKLTRISFIVLVSLALAYFFLARPVFAVYKDAQALFPHAKAAKEAFSSQNLEQFEKEVDIIHSGLVKLQADIGPLKWTSHIPKIGLYFADAKHATAAGIVGCEAGQILVESLKPFSSILGFAETEEEKTLTGQEKLAQIVKIAPQLSPAVDEAVEKLKLVAEELENLHPEIYPEEIRGIPIKEKIIKLTDCSLREISSKCRLPITDYLEDIKPVVEILPSVLGQPTPQNYLILFQNDKELRPTGGFLTAYALVSFDQGRFSIIKSDDIYRLDPKISILPVPYPISRFLKLPGFYLRDTNFSPDFKNSISDFELYYQKTGSPQVAGIIALDTHFVEKILEISGPIAVPGYGTDFSGYPNLPESCRTGGENFTSENVVCRLELYAEKILVTSGERKAILGELMQNLVGWVLSAPKEQWQPLVKTVFEEAAQKHLLVYMHDETLQNMIEKYNFGGKIKEYEGDYLHVNDANLAGLKSDLYMKRAVEQKISVAADGTVTKKLTLTYTNSGRFDGWLNATNRNYVRVYVPKGSKLLRWSGGEYSQVGVFEDLGKTVFDNFVLTKPLSSSVLTFEYELPFKIQKMGGFSLTEYKLLIQKQPGLEDLEYSVEIDGQKESFILEKDRELRFKL